MSEAIVTLKKGEGRMLKSGGLWIFDNEIASILVSNFIERVVRQLQIGWVIRLGKGLYEHCFVSF